MIANGFDSLTTVLPFAWFNLENLKDQTQAYQEVLVHLSTQLKREFSVPFPRFSLCMKVLQAREGGDPAPIFDIDPKLNDALNSALSFLPNWATATIKVSKGHLLGAVENSSRLKDFVQRIGGMSKLVDLVEQMSRDDDNLPKEMIKCFAQDLDEGLKQRNESACRAVLFLDTYETLWTGRENTLSVQAMRLDDWVRQLASFCLGCGVVLVISGRDRLMWVEDQHKPSWQPEEIEQHQLGGLSNHDAHFYLSVRGIGLPPESGILSPLQKAITYCCNTETSSTSQTSCHLQYLALCADIVDNTRRENKIDPKPEAFLGIPSDDVAKELAFRFLKSLHNANMMLWTEALSLTPRFDKESALALSRDKNFEAGAGGWTQLKRFSFMEVDANGFFRMHRTMREVLPIHITEVEPQSIHEWFSEYWTERGELSLAFYHHWCLDPKGVLFEWKSTHDKAVKDAQMAVARQLVAVWEEIISDKADLRLPNKNMGAVTRLTIGRAMLLTAPGSRNNFVLGAIEHLKLGLEIISRLDSPYDWATTHLHLGLAYIDISLSDRDMNIKQGVVCFQLALDVFTEEDWPVEWAKVQINLGIANWRLHGNKNLEQPIFYFMAALRVLTEVDNAVDWAGVQQNLGVIYSCIPTKDERNIARSILHYRAALRVFTEQDHPGNWALTQFNLGNTYSEVLTVQGALQGVSHFQAALRIYTENEYPKEWASIQEHLAMLLQQLAANGLGEGLERAIEYHQAALKVLTQEEYPDEWATIQVNLGFAYASVQTGDPTENLYRAIAHYQAALQTPPESRNSSGWGQAHFNLGSVYSALTTGNPSENLTRAIEHYESALEAFDEKEDAPTWGQIQFNLAHAYAHLGSGDTLKHLEKSMHHYKASLVICQEGKAPKHLALTTMRLGQVSRELFLLTNNEAFQIEARKWFSSSIDSFRRLHMDNIVADLQDTMQGLD